MELYGKFLNGWYARTIVVRRAWYGVTVRTAGGGTDHTDVGETYLTAVRSVPRGYVNVLWYARTRSARPYLPGTAYPSSTIRTQRVRFIPKFPKIWAKFVWGGCGPYYYPNVLPRQWGTSYQKGTVVLCRYERSTRVRTVPNILLF